MSKYPNAVYRVSVKALIRNKDGHVLVVKEDDHWSLPGGGVDHGEDYKTALKRELFEEIAVTQILDSRFLTVHTVYAESREVWFMWVLHEVQIDLNQNLMGEHVKEVMFIDPTEMQSSPIRSLQRAYSALKPHL